MYKENLAARTAEELGNPLFFQRIKVFTVMTAWISTIFTRCQSEGFLWPKRLIINLRPAYLDGL